MSELDVLVVGAGISGLSIAHCLARSGLSVEVWESASRVGGKINTVEKQGYRLESAASMVMNFRCEIDPFLRQAGLESYKQARAPTARRYIADKEELLEVPTGFRDLLTTPILSSSGKLRLLAEPFIPGSKFQGQSVAEFVRRRLGKEFLDKVFQPYVAGPLASDANLAEAQATMPKLIALEKHYGSLGLGALISRFSRRGRAARPDVFSFSGGMGHLTSLLAKQGGFCVRKGLQVKEFWPTNGGWMTSGVQQGVARSTFSKRVVVTTPAQAATSIINGIDTKLAKLLSGIEYAPIKVVHTGFNRNNINHALNGSGFLVPQSSGFIPNGCLWMSSLFPDQAPHGQVLFSNYLGGARNPDAASWSSERSLSAVMEMLNRLLGVNSDPDMLHIKTHASGLPLYHGAYSQRLEAIEQRLVSLPGLHLEANYKGGVSVRDRILCAEKISRRIVQQLSKSRKSVFIPKHGLVKNPLPVTDLIS